MIGQHIRALRGGRWVHAIDCGDETVIDLDGEGGSQPRVRRSYRPEFVSRAEVVEVVAHRAPRFAPEEVVARAYSLVGDAALGARFTDGAAFATWCATGRLDGGAERGARRAAAKAAQAPAAKARGAKKRPSAKDRR